MASMSSSNRAIVVRMIMRENSIDNNIHGVTIYTLTVASCSTWSSRSTWILPFCVLSLVNTTRLDGCVEEAVCLWKRAVVSHASLLLFFVGFKRHYRRLPNILLCVQIIIQPTSFTHVFICGE